MAGAALVVVQGASVGARLTVEGHLDIGRNQPGAGRLGGDPELSRSHARITVGANGPVIEDLGSSNGTWVNGEQVQAPRALAPGDRIEVGATVLEVARDTAAPATGGRAPTARHPAAGPPPPSPAPVRPPPPPPSARPIEQAGSPSVLGRVPDMPVPGAGGELLHAGRRIGVPPAGATIGRAADNDVSLDDDLVSRHHARVAFEGGRPFVADLNTVNGTFLNGEQLHGEARWLHPGDTIELGDQVLRFAVGQRTAFGTVMPEGPPAAARQIELTGDRVRIGRDPANEVALDDPNVSRFHAEIRRRGDAVELVDLGSRNGTRLDGRLVQRAPLPMGAEVGVGPFRLIFDGARLLRRDDRGALRLDAAEVTVDVKAGKRILDRASLAVEPGELVVIVGESGSGKSTLVKALAGVNPPSAGTIAVSGESVSQRLTDIGYVPQDEIVHGALTVVEALRYAARLRLPRDSSGADVDAAVQRVVGELGLEEHAQTRIGSLSGGQRKRAGMAAELLSRPSLLFLDEPTTGLDPGLETRMMELFRSLAEPGTRAVVVVTHATQNIGLADKLCVMGRGGHLCYFGPPDDALRFFGTDSFNGIYTALETGDVEGWRARFEHERALEPPTAASGDRVSTGGPHRRAAAGARARRPRVGPQAAVLASRYAKLLIRDQRNLAILLGQVPVIALAIGLLFKADVFDAPGSGRPGDAVHVLFLLVTTAIWLGSIDGSREIIKERSLAVREAAVGVRAGAYLISKVVVLFTLVAVQVVILCAIVFALRPLGGQGIDAYLGVVGLLIVTGWISVAVGLAISTMVNSEDQATSVIPLALIPQLLFAGDLVAVKSMSAIAELVSNVVYSRWAFAGVGTVVEMNERIAGDREFARADRYGRDFFDIGIGLDALILGAFLFALLGVVWLVLRRRRA